MASAPLLNFQAYNPVDTAINAALGVYGGITQGQNNRMQTAKLEAELPYVGQQAEAELAYKDALIAQSRQSTANSAFDLEMAKKLKPLEFQEEQLKYEQSKREYDLNKMLSKYGANDPNSRQYLLAAIAKDYRKTGGKNFPEFSGYMQGMGGATQAPANGAQQPSMNTPQRNPIDAGISQNLAQPTMNKQAPNAPVNVAPKLMEMLGINSNVPPAINEPVTPSASEPLSEEPSEKEMIAMDLTIPDTNKQADETANAFVNPMEEYNKAQEAKMEWEQKGPEEKIGVKAAREAYEKGKVTTYNKTIEKLTDSSIAAEKQNAELEQALNTFKNIPHYQKGMIGGLVTDLAQESKLFESFKSGLVLTEMQQAVGVSTDEDREEMAKKYGNRTFDDDTIEELITVRMIMNDRENQRLDFFSEREGKSVPEINREWNQRMKERKLFDDPRLKKLKFQQELRKMTPTERRQFIEKKKMEKALSQEGGR